MIVARSVDDFVCLHTQTGYNNTNFEKAAPGMPARVGFQSVNLSIWVPLCKKRPSLVEPLVVVHTNLQAEQPRLGTITLTSP
jgi:hypothetical protein